MQNNVVKSLATVILKKIRNVATELYGTIEADFEGREYKFLTLIVLA